MQLGTIQSLAGATQDEPWYSSDLAGLAWCAQHLTLKQVLFDLFRKRYHGAPRFRQ